MNNGELNFDIPSGHPSGHLWLARDQMALKNIDTARDYIERTQNEKSREKLRIIGKLYYLDNNYSLSLRYLKKAEALQDVLAIAKSEEKLENHHVALMAYRTAWNIDKLSATLPYVTYLSDQRNYEEAIKVLRKALSENPNSTQVLTWKIELAKLFRKTNQWENAEDLYHEILKKYPSDERAYIGLGWLTYSRDHDSSNAMDMLKKAVSIAPGNATPYYLIGEILAKEHRYKKALYWFQKAMKINPSNQNWYLKMGEVAELDGNVDLAIHIYNKMIARFPAVSEPYFRLARIYHKQNRYSESLFNIEIVLKHLEDPNFDHYLLAGRIYRRTGDLNKSLEYLQLALESNPENREVKDLISDIKNHQD